MDECIFCKIVKGDIPAVKLYEDDKALVILDRFPSSLGHSLVISKEHFKDIEDVQSSVFSHMAKLAVEYSKKIREATGCDGINILQNNGEVAGQTVFHTHIHIIPRYKEDNVTITWRALDPSIDDLIDLKNKIR